MTVYQKKLRHAQELQKQAHDKSLKSKKYALDDKI